VEHHGSATSTSGNFGRGEAELSLSSRVAFEPLSVFPNPTSSPADKTPESTSYRTDLNGAGTFYLDGHSVT
jgi:beta-lactamase superfamily II metal-dependent hydrolase